MEFTKMHGLGNDFIVLEQWPEDIAATARSLCSRHLGVGADGLLLVCPSDNADVKMRIVNADGSEAEMCGNGIRCFAKYVYERRIVHKTNMKIETLAGVVRPALTVEGGVVTGVRVDMGEPVFAPDQIPVLAVDPLSFKVEAAGEKWTVSTVLMGVPHTVVLVDDVAAIDIAALGPAIETNLLFPQKTNVNFVQVASGGLRIRTWERGAGATMACGTGACAAAVVCHKKGLTGRKTRVMPETGALLIEWAEDGHVFMTGPAAHVFRGETL